MISKINSLWYRHLDTINHKPNIEVFFEAEHYFMGGKHLRETLQKYVEICLAFSKLSFHKAITNMIHDVTWLHNWFIYASFDHISHEHHKRTVVVTWAWQVQYIEIVMETMSALLYFHRFYDCKNPLDLQICNIFFSVTQQKYIWKPLQTL